MAALGETHACEWRDEAERLTAANAELHVRLEQLERHVFGRRSEKLPRVAEALGDLAKPTREETLKKRRARREARAELPEVTIRHEVPPEARHCPKCGGTDLRPLGAGKVTTVFEYKTARLIRELHVQETLSCRCGEGVVTASAPKAVEKGQYGPGLIAHVVTAKCLDSMPLYRQAKVLSRAGVPVARTTLGDLFHAAARATEPLYRRLLELIAADEYVRADETPQRVLAEGKTRRAFVWTFRTEKLLAYLHSHTRSGETPLSVLGGTKGYLQVDGYTGYNAVTLPEGRVRVGCWAHVRRKIFEALSTAPEAQVALDLIVDLYRVEHHAAAANHIGSATHLAARQQQSAAVVEKLRYWLAVEEPKHPPKSPLGQAIRYALGQWEALSRFLEDARLALDNNASERALRTIALGRKNYLFVGNDEAGENLAGLFSLLATCEENGVNPEQYLADVLPRLQSHPNSRLDELLPHRWKPADSS